MYIMYLCVSTFSFQTYTDDVELSSVLRLGENISPPTLKMLMIFEYRIFQRQTCVAFWSLRVTMYNTVHPPLKLSISASQNGPMST